MHACLNMRMIVKTEIAVRELYTGYSKLECGSHGVELEIWRRLI